MKRLRELLEQLKKLARDYLTIDKNRLAILKKPLFWGWLLIHLCLFAVVYSSLSASLFFNLIIIAIALSPLCEKLTLFMDNVRRLATQAEKEIIPLFESVKSSCQFIYRKCNIKIVDTLTINAFSSPNNVVITRGMLQTLPQNELSGVIAHELAHIKNGDATLKSVLDAYYNILFLNITIICMLINALAGLFCGTIIGSILSFLYSVIRGLYNILIYISYVLINGGQRRQEYKADLQACKWGFSIGLKDALYRFHAMEITDKKKMSVRFVAPHPRTAFRIEKVEKYLSEPFN